MISTFSQILFLINALAFTSIIFMHLTKKNSSLVFLYVCQSLLTVILLYLSSSEGLSYSLALVLLITFVIKVIIAPYFFMKFIKKSQMKFASNVYLNTPLTLIAVASLVIIAFSQFKPLAILSPGNENSLLLSIATIFISFLLIINHKGALSQIFGVLAIENGIVSFAALAGLEETFSLRVGIIFDIFIWIIIATIFVSMIYKQFGSLDVTAMKHLKD
jgi:hydrogenase-4 component E